MTLFTRFILCCLVAVATANNPYTPGPYKTGVYVIDPKTHGSPLHSSVYFPISDKVFNPVPFIGGFNGYMVAELYSDFLQDVASHGYVVIGMDPFFPGSGESSPSHSLKFESLVKGKAADNFFVKQPLNPDALSIVGGTEKYVKQFEWLKENLRNVSDAQINWDRPSIMCQSSGCDASLRMMDDNRELVKAAVFLDPVSMFSFTLKPFESKIKFLAHLSPLSERFPTCCIPGIGWKRIYDTMKCVRVRLETEKTGHCDILNQSAWKACNFVGLCRTTKDEHLEAYHKFLAGLSHAFLEWTVEGKADMEKYVVDPEHMPYTITELVYDKSC